MCKSQVTSFQAAANWMKRIIQIETTLVTWTVQLTQWPMLRPENRTTNFDHVEVSTVTPGAPLAIGRCVSFSADATNRKRAAWKAAPTKCRLMRHDTSQNGEERGCRVFHVPIGLVISRQTTKDGRVFDEKALVTNWQLCRLPIFFNFFNLAC